MLGIFESIDHNALAAYSALAAALVATIAVFAESRRARFSLGIEIILQLRTQFQSPEMRRVRAEAARALLEGKPSNVRDVLNFLETVATLARRGVVDHYMVWHTFYHWLDGYCQGAIDEIRSRREKVPTQWSEVTRLHRRLGRIEFREARRLGVQSMPTTVAGKRDFLLDEAGVHDPGGAEPTPPLLLR